jgi:RNA polymerase sigma-70 factor (ECF subfamily)
MDADTRIDAIWREHRPSLVDLAFRMLGNISDAEDIVSEAFARLLRAELDDIEDVKGWLVVVVSRLCLDTLRSARHRREARRTPLDDLLAHTSDPAPDPADRVTLDDSVRMALLVVLEKLSPAERAVFVLHDVFRYPFETVASIVGRSVVSCRQLATRARRRVEAETGPARFSIGPAEHHRVAERFIAACASGDLSGLMELLDADVAGEVDLGDEFPPVPVQVGRQRVGRNLLMFFGPAAGVTLVSHTVNGAPGVLSFKDGKLLTLLVFDTREGMIADIHAIQNPARLAALSGLVEGPR